MEQRGRGTVPAPRRRDRGCGGAPAGLSADARRRPGRGPTLAARLSDHDRHPRSAAALGPDRDAGRDRAALAARDPRVPWPAKAVAACVAAYALNPIDLIPDFVPVLGYLDGLVVVPLGILLAVKLVPPDLMAEFREEARRRCESPTGCALPGDPFPRRGEGAIAQVELLSHL
jgi:uncharacterized membrane protein YkvA (DUF1232 family)